MLRQRQRHSTHFICLAERDLLVPSILNIFHSKDGRFSLANVTAYMIVTRNDREEEQPPMNGEFQEFQNLPKSVIGIFVLSKKKLYM